MTLHLDDDELVSCVACGLWAVAVNSKKDFVWDKQDLLVPAATSVAPAAR